MNKVLVTGSAGHLGEALCWTLAREGISTIGVDVQSSLFTACIGSITEKDLLTEAMQGVDTVFHTATLHKPHVVTHDKEAFISTNVLGTQILLECAVAAGVKRFIFTSTTSVFGSAMKPPAGQHAVWVDEALTPIPKNIYGVTKLAAEQLCRLAHEESGLNCLVLRTSRFFPEDDDSAQVRSVYSADNSKANEFLNRRAELEDMVSAHFCAARCAEEKKYGLYIISATSPFRKVDLPLLNADAASVVLQYFPECEDIYRQLEWLLPKSIDRVYSNEKARLELQWNPKYDFQSVLNNLKKSAKLPRSEVVKFVGSKGYHDQVFDDGPYPV